MYNIMKVNKHVIIFIIIVLLLLFLTKRKAQENFSNNLINHIYVINLAFAKIIRATPTPFIHHTPTD